ncbi:HPP family protein [Aureimonas leprariae]|uniref:HPP family protein n=1 Tax=Plantimonas leprariae TaxID=2615207 RepID=A0A7V7PKP6_9HYPH|nr:HPP family protein [Aureimonas leprariae]KAB0676542.1 HPP family protein [Aureimonas leprariae]
MLRHARDFIARHEPETLHLAVSLKAGVGGLVGIGIAGGIASATGMPFLLAPFGATAVLLFAQPQSPLAQPANVVGGYFVAVLISLVLMTFFPAGWVTAAVGVGIAIAVMAELRLTHPPAGAIPIVAITGAMAPQVLIETVMLGALLLVAVAVLHHRIPPRHTYPKPASQPRTVPGEKGAIRAASRRRV